MNAKEQVIELAKQAGLAVVPNSCPVAVQGLFIELERFAKLVRNAYRAELLAGRKGPVCRLWVEPETCNYIVDRCDHPPSETIDVYTADQLAAAVLAERNAALEEAKQLAWTEIMREGALVTWGDADTLGDRVIEKLESLKEPTP